MSIAFFFAVVSFINPVMAQKNKNDDKKLKKEWKKKVKTYKKNPLALKNTFDGYQKQIDELTKKNAELSQRYTETQAALDKCETELRGKNGEIQALQEKLAQANAALEAMKNVQDKGIERGLMFKIQVGAFQYFNLNKYLESTQENFQGESGDNLNKYTIGKFRDLEMAESFKKDLKRLGIKDAWLVSYYDGVRIDIKEAKRRMTEGGAQ